MGPFVTTMNIVLPLSLLVALGYFLRRREVFSQETCARMNTVAFNVLIPSMVFYNIYTADLTLMADPRLLGFSFLSITAVFLLLMFLVPRFEKDPAKIGVIVQGSFRSSFVVLGMGLAASMYPGANLSVIAITSTVVAPMFNVYAVIALEFFSHQKPDLRKIFRGIVTNPLIVGSVLAILCLALGLRLPVFLDSTVKSLSSCATTVSLLVLGGTLDFSGIRAGRGPLIAACLLKLVVLPLIFLPISVALGFRGMSLLAMLILFGSPSAVSCHVMAVQAEADGQLAGQIVVFTTCLSAFTLFGFIYVLLSLGYL